MRVYLQIYIAVFFITGRALRGSALFLFFQTKDHLLEKNKKNQKGCGDLSL